MEDFIATIQQEVNSRIKSIESTEKNLLKRATTTSEMLEDVFLRLKEFVSGYSFRDEQEEIEFFKVIKPRIFCDLIYYREVYNIEMNRPVGTEEELIRYLNYELDKIQEYTSKRIDFYRYMRSGGTNLDREYFLRCNNRGDGSQYLDAFYFERDPVFSTCGDFCVAKFLANEKLQAFIREQLKNIAMNQDAYDPASDNTPRWTETKTGLIEILYALDALNCIDGGNISLSRIVNYVEQVFDIRLGNITRAFSEMKVRNNPTAFLDKMKEALEKKIDELEEKNVQEQLERKNRYKKKN